jgi:hypothetical protein
LSEQDKTLGFFALKGLKRANAWPLLFLLKVRKIFLPSKLFVAFYGDRGYIFSMIIIPPHGLDENNHLDQVIADMRQMGAPVIKAVWLEAYVAWMALEGSHRIVAAKRLGLEPQIEAVEYDPEATTDELVPDSYQDTHTLEELADNCWMIQPIEF